MVSAILSSSTPFVEFDARLIRKFNGSGLRYRCYPTAEHFTESFGYRDYLQAIAGLRTRGNRNPLALYVHIPFCDTICYYCVANKIITRNHDKASAYLDYLKREIEMQGQLFSGMNQVEKLHVGGGTPTYLSRMQMAELSAHLRRWFKFAADDAGEYSIEIDPRSATTARIASLREQGFNRLTISVQDFDPEVQKAVNRIQPEGQTLGLLRAAQDANFRSVSIDLLYGLPRQNVMTLAQTLMKLVDAGPDSILLRQYLHMPHAYKSHGNMDEKDIPGVEARLDMLSVCCRRLSDAGYVYIGMGHFTRSDDALVVAQRQGRLHRNYQGYSTHTDMDMVACGVSAISAVGATYSQNVKTLDAYYDHLDRNELPIARGIKLNMDDMLRRLIIQMLMCNFELSIASIETAYPIIFKDYFAVEIEKLQALAQDGLLTMDGEWINISAKGRMLVHVICSVFDRYFNAKPALLRSAYTI